MLAGVEERAEEVALAAWLRDRGHGVVISDVHLVEALAIRDKATRSARLDHLVALRAQGPYPKPVGSLKAEEYVAEVKRHRPGWIEPFPRTDGRSASSGTLRRWTLARRDRAALAERHARHCAVLEPAIRITREVQKQNRALHREGYDAVNGLVLGNHVVAISGPWLLRIA